MRKFSWLEGLALIGLLLIGAAVYLAFGLAATLGYAGGACVTVALVLALLPGPGRNEGGQP
jgi:hypothetical protein